MTRWLDPLSDLQMPPRQGVVAVTAFCALFWGLLYVLPQALVAPWADADTGMAVIEVYRRQWEVHGHPLRSSWLFGGGSLFRGLAHIPGWSPSVLLSLLVGAKSGALLWAWIQLSLGGTFAYGWARAEGANHRGATLVALLGWCSLWLVRHMVDGHLVWPAFCWLLGLGWLARARVSVAATTAGGLALGLALWSSSPLQVPFYGFPVLALGLTRGGALRGVVLALAVGLTSMSAMPVILDTFEAHALYARDRTVDLQDLKFIGDGHAWTRNLMGLVVPFASYGFHAEGNLLALMPLLFWTGRPSRRVIALAVVLLVIGLLPGFAGIRQLERCWWGLVLLAAWHIAMNESAISRRLVLLSLGATTAVSGALFALRALTQVEVPRADRVRGLNGVASVQESYLANDGIDGGVYAAVRQGFVVHRPFTHVALDEVTPTDVLVLEGEAVLHEGLLQAEMAEGDRIVLALRPDSAMWLFPPEGLTVASEHGHLVLVATKDLGAVELIAE